MDDLYALEDPLNVVLVTVVMGGLAAALAGRAIAQTWRPLWHAFAYMVLLAAAVRFIHFALFDGELLSLPSYLVDTIYLAVIAMLAWRITLTTQMTRQYYWRYERTSAFTWRERAPRPS